MAYKAIVAFKDLRTGYYYNAGDTFPAFGDIDKARVKQLMEPTTQRGPLIAEVPDEPKKKKARKTEEKKED